jgi:glutaredoxin
VTRQIQLTLISKPGCHLCDDAKLSLDRALSDFRAANSSVQIELNELNMLEDPALLAKYAEEIPVLLINGKQHSYWTIDELRLRASLEKIADTES